MSGPNQCKNKWHSQKVNKHFKNVHMNKSRGERKHLRWYWYERHKCDMLYPQSQITQYFHDEHGTCDNFPDFPPDSWSCSFCTFENLEKHQKCEMCHRRKVVPKVEETTTSDVLMGDYLQPVLGNVENEKYDDFDQQIQYAIELSLQMTDSDDTDSDKDSSYSATSTTSSKSRSKPKRVRKRRKKSNFATYWTEMAEYHQYLKKNLKYIRKVNKRKLEDKKAKREIQTMWRNHGFVDLSTFKILQQERRIKSAIPTMSQVYHWLSERYAIHNFSIQNVLSPYVLGKFAARGTRSHKLEVVYHGTRFSVASNIIRQGLIVGGTKGVPISTGAVYGHGVYCSPNIHTAACYESGALFICLVRANNCNRSGNIYVCPNDSDILPVYLATFSYSAQLTSRGVFKFQPGWIPLNTPCKGRRLRRKWAALWKLQD